MATQVKQIRGGLGIKQTLSPSTRFVLILLVWGIQSMYIPTSNRTFGGIEPKLPIDIFPLWAVWVIPYVLCYLFWLSGMIWAIFKMEDHMFRSLIAAFFVTCTLAVSTFIFFPTYVEAATISGADIFSSMLRSIHENWGRYNAFPSGHVYITVLLAIFYHRWYPQYKVYWVLIPTLISFSTLFTYQHYIVDILGGLVVALIGYHAGLRWAGFSTSQPKPEKSRILQPPS